MGEMVEFASNGNNARGYLVTPESGSGPGVIVIQEWWGLNPQLKGVADRLAGEGFTALAPDLYHGELAGHDEMDKAGQLMSTLPMDRAAKDMSGAVDYLRNHDATAGDKVGVIGFCMGGMLTWVLAAHRPDAVAAATPFYGAPLDPSSEPDWSKLEAAVQAHAAENDDYFPPDKQEELAERLRGMGKDVTVHVYPGTGHAFMNEVDALGTYNADAAKQAWERAVSFLRSHLA